MGRPDRVDRYPRALALATGELVSHDASRAGPSPYGDLRDFRGAGATGLEPSTSGVTGGMGRMSRIPRFSLQTRDFQILKSRRRADWRCGEGPICPQIAGRSPPHWAPESSWCPIGIRAKCARARAPADPERVCRHPGPSRVGAEASPRVARRGGRLGRRSGRARMARSRSATVRPTAPRDGAACLLREGATGATIAPPARGAAFAGRCRSGQRARSPTWSSSRLSRKPVLSGGVKRICGCPRTSLVVIVISRS